jgi:microcystin-dependent protein
MNPSAFMKTKRFKTVILCLNIAVALLVSHHALRAETRLLPFQGSLSDANGNPLPDGTKVVQFKIYDAPVGGQAVWNGEVQKLSVNRGLISTLLGTKADLAGVDFDQNLYLELTIDANDDEQITPADPPLLPRQSIVPAVFAKESADSRLLDGYDWSALFGTENPADGALLDSKIRDGSISASKLAPRSIHEGLVANDTLTLATLAQEVIDQLVPPGSIIAYGGGTLPNGWVLCDGRALNSAEFPRLFQSIQTAWGNGSNDADVSTDFNVPDLRGRFLRGVDGIAGRDPDSVARTTSATGGNAGNNVGSSQEDSLASHRHAINLSATTSSAGAHSHGVIRDDGVVIRWGDGGGNSSDRIDAADSDGSDPRRLRTTVEGAHSHTVSLSGQSGFTGAADTRPKNVYVNYIIKY